MNRKRVGIVGLLHESNTFVSGRTTLEHFREDLLLEGVTVRDRMEYAPHEVGGFIEGLESGGIEPIPIFLARAVPHGIIESSAFEVLVGRLIDGVRKAGPLDGILAAPHGATVAEGAHDADGFWLEAVRHQIGPSNPLIATVDPHANLSQRMVSATDAIIAYETNPHLDQKETGLRAAELMVRTLRGDVSPIQAAMYPPMAINIQSQNTAEPPLADVYAEARKLAGDVLSISIVLGFPYADVPEMGSSVLVVTNGDEQQARATATQVGNRMLEQRHRFEPTFVSPLQAMKKVAGSNEGPVVLLDMGDNIGGGAPGNSTALLHECRLNEVGPAFACLYDPSGVMAAIAAGTDAVLRDFPVGDPDNPFSADFVVDSIHDGRFSETSVRHGGFMDFDQGNTVILRMSNESMTVMITSRRVPPFSLKQLTAFGIEPSRFRLLVAKGVIAPLAAYAPISAGGFIHVDTPGPTRADISKLVYWNRRNPMFPFERQF